MRMSVWNRRNNDMEFVTIAEFVCECLAKNTCICVFVYETCVLVWVCVRACTVDVWLCIAVSISVRVGSWDTWAHSSSYQTDLLLPQTSLPSSPTPRKQETSVCLWESVYIGHIPKMTFRPTQDGCSDNDYEGPEETWDWWDFGSIMLIWAISVGGMCSLMNWPQKNEAKAR